MAPLGRRVLGLEAGGREREVGRVPAGGQDRRDADRGTGWIGRDSWEPGKELSSEGGVGQLSIKEPTPFSDRSSGTISVQTGPDSARPEPVGLDALQAVCFCFGRSGRSALRQVEGCSLRSA